MPYQINLCGIVLLKLLYLYVCCICVAYFLTNRDHLQKLFQTGYKLVVIVLCHFCYCRVGYFRLTEPEGLTYIGSCNERGFHCHNTEVPLFEVRDPTI